MGGLSIALRPTAVVPWAFLGLALLAQQASCLSAAKLAGAAGTAAALAVATGVGVDTFLYGGEGPSFVLWNFLEFNMSAGAAALYGSHPWHWYLTQSLPVMLGLMLPLFPIGVFQVLGSTKSRGAGLFWAAFVAFCVAVYSTNSHKEFRFLLPLYPVLFMFTGVAMHSIAKPFFADSPLPQPQAESVGAEAAAASDQDAGGESSAPALRSRRSMADDGAAGAATDHAAGEVSQPNAKEKTPPDTTAPPTAPAGTVLYAVTLGVLVVGNVAAAVYLGGVHQRGVVDAVDFIAAEAAAFRATPGMLYNPNLHGATGATAQAHEWNYIRERASLGVLNHALVPGFPPPTGDKSVLRKQPLDGPTHFTWEQGNWLDVSPRDAAGLSDRFKHSFEPKPHEGSAMSLLQNADEAIEVWLQWPVLRERLAVWVARHTSVDVAAALGLVALDPWGNAVSKPNVKRAQVRWDMQQRQRERDAAQRAGSGEAEYVPMIVHFWMSCHSTPFYSLVHEPIEMTQLECPPLALRSGDTDVSSFMQDPGEFLHHKWYGASPKPAPPALPLKKPTLAVHDARYAGPVRGMRLPALRNESEWMRRVHATRERASFHSLQPYNATRESHSLPSTGQLPTHIVTTARLAKQMRGWLLAHEYFEAARFFHAHVQADMDADPGADFSQVVVLRHGSWTPWALMAGRAVVHRD